MIQILVTSISDSGCTDKMAAKIAEGAREIRDTTVITKTTETVTTNDFLESDGILFGTPVHMGAPDWRIKKLLDTVIAPLWMRDEMVGKIGAVFATGSGFGKAGGGAELAMVSMLNTLAELGMIIIPLPKNTPGYAKGGIHWGPYARTGNDEQESIGVQDDQLEAAACHGMNVARAALALQNQIVFHHS
ncbi:Flavodoxin family protein [Sulfidibacter corallicola]|uniref:Flavodoxin family protein n=1 Tax=Sulfidibacter corallicola TaxID=2818388 RepID=A0A8A4TQN1_SULCO|nr:NAD(P)H-dependent oxidoreductase [Sulfidibacter corallicola]QTD51308.1 flavodoxin family protein [Sulfidibacter corallicola]